MSQALLLFALFGRQLLDNSCLTFGIPGDFEEARSARNYARDNMILKHLECLLVLQYFINLVAPEVATEKALPEPLNLSLTWATEFLIKLSWNAPKDLDASCKVKYIINSTRTGQKSNISSTPCLYKEYNVDMNDAVNYTVITSPVESPGDSHIAACSEYQYRAAQRTGCHLRGAFLQYDVYFLVNGTLNGSYVRNNFLVLPRYHVKPQAPKYRVQVKAVYQKWCGDGGSDWSEEEIYGVDEWHREKLFPKIPQPSLIFKDMLNSNKEQKSSIGNLYVPVKEEVECKISLEKDPTLPMMQPDH
ncbi:unnamed protein product [Coregonus sp. 'balchen']|nr:unnamed protein product [Coregonus sp. 'balchen']